MPTLQSSFINFTIISTWSGYEDTMGELRYTNSTTITQNKTYSLAGLPADAILSSATLTSTVNSPLTGVAIRRVDDVSFSGTKDVLSKIQALSGNYSSGVTFAYKFKANGESGGVGSHSSPATFKDNLLTIVYTLPASTFTLNKMSLDAGQSITCTITPADTAYSHRVTWYLNNTYKQVNTIAAGTATPSDTFTIPMDWCRAIPSSTSTTCSCTVETLSGSTVTGSFSDNFTMTIPASVVPTITSLSKTGVDLYWDLYVKGYSKVQLTINGASGAYDSTIASYRIAGVTYTGTPSPYTTGLLTTAGTNTFYATVTDSRGRISAQASTTLTVTNYSIPNITAMSADRCDEEGNLEDEGTYGKFTMSYTWSNIGSNTRSTAVYYRERGETTWIEGSATLISSGGYFLVNAPFDVATKYDVRFRIYDYFTSGSPIYAYGTLLTAAYIMDFNEYGDGVCIGGAATIRNAFEVAEDKESYYKGETLDARFLKLIDYTASDVLTKIKTVDGSGSEIDSDKLDGQEGSYYLPVATYTAANVLSKLLTVDGSGSEIDADKLDGLDSTDFAKKTADSTWTSSFSFDAASTDIFLVVCSNGTSSRTGVFVVTAGSSSASIVTISNTGITASASTFTCTFTASGTFLASAIKLR